MAKTILWKKINEKRSRLSSELLYCYVRMQMVYDYNNIKQPFQYANKIYLYFMWFQ